MLSDDDAQSQSSIATPRALCFHKVSHRLTYGSTNYSPRRLKRLLERLRKDGYVFAKEAGNRTSHHDKLLLITFDDAYAHLLESLPPLMKEFRFRPLVFVPTAWIGSANRWDYSYHFREERHLNLMELRQLRDIGVRFGSHGHRHVDLTSLPDDVLRSELDQSKSVMEEATGQEIDSISFPFGRVDVRVTNFAQLAGFTSGYSMRYPESSDSPICKGRYPIYFYDTPASVQRKLGDGFGRQFERARARLTNRLSYGTILLNRLKRKDDSIV